MALYNLDSTKKPRKAARRKPGVVPKDDDISIRPPTQGKLTREQRRAAASEKIRIEREIRQEEKRKADLAAEIQRYKEKIEEAKRKAGVPEDEEVDVSLSAKMLADMRWVYSQVDGRQKLMDMVKGDDKQFAFMIKELIRFEAAVAENEAGKKGRGGSGGFFVVIKGLEDENRLKAAMDGQANEVSNQRIAITVKNPDGSEMEVSKPAAKPAYKPPVSTPPEAPPSISKTRPGEEDW